MKKLLCVFLVSVMLVGLCACSGNSNTASEKNEVIEETIDIGEGKEFSFGKAANGKYENEFLDLSCDLSDGWEFYSDEKILELNNIPKENLGSENLAEFVKDANVIYDMFASDSESGNKIYITLEKQSPAQLEILNIKEKLKSQIESKRTTYETIGYTDVDIKHKKIKLDGKSVDSLKVKSNIQNTDKTQTLEYYETIIAFRKGSYVANISISSFETDKYNEISSLITVK